VPSATRCRDRQHGCQRQNGHSKQSKLFDLQLGDMLGGSPGVPYSDYTGYAPVNDWGEVAVR
jgi:hypothetical protein